MSTTFQFVKQEGLDEPIEVRSAFHRATRILALVGVLWLILFAAPTAHSQPAPDDSVVRVGVLRDWPPYYVLDENDEPSGFAVEAFEAIARRADLKPRYLLYNSFPDLTAALVSGEVDVVPSFGILEDRNALFTKSYDAFSVAFFTRTSTPGKPRPEEVPGDVAVVRSNVGVTLAAAHDPPLRTHQYDSVREAIFRLLAGEVDGLIYPAPVIIALARDAGVEDRIQISQPELVEVKRAIGVTPGRPDLLDRLDRHIEPFIASAEYGELHRRWFSRAPPFWTAKRVGVAAFAILIIAGLIFGISRLRERRRAAAALRRSEEKYRTLFRSIQDAIVIADAERNIIDFNPAFHELFGYDRDEIIGRKTVVLYESEKEFARLGEQLRALKQNSGFTFIVRFRSKTGHVFPGETRVFHQYDDAGNISGLVGVIRDVTEETRNRLELAEKSSALDRLTRQLIDAQETERARIARELHDELGGALTALYFDAARLRDWIDDPAIANKVTEMAGQINDAMDLVRTAARRLRPKVIDDFGLVPALEDLLHEFSDRFGIAADLTVTCEPDLGRSTDIMVYRIVQEALTNVARHSKASTVKVRIYERNQKLVLEVRDDGRGITTAEAVAGESLGLSGMKERAEMIGGRLVIEPLTGSGTMVRLRIPRQEEVRDDPTSPRG